MPHFLTEDSVVKFGYWFRRQGSHPMHRSNDRFGVGGIAIGIGEVRRMDGKLKRLLKVAAAEPDARCNKTAIHHCIVRSGILDSPAFIDRPKNLIRTAP